jgi:hypothetical protein
VELVEPVSVSDITCPSCGSHFSLADDKPETFRADPGQTIGQLALIISSRGAMLASRELA